MSNLHISISDSSRVILIPVAVRLNGLGIGMIDAALSGAVWVTATSWYCNPSRAGLPILSLNLHPLQPSGLSSLNLLQVVGPVAALRQWLTFLIVGL